MFLKRLNAGLTREGHGRWQESVQPSLFCFVWGLFNRGKAGVEISASILHRQEPLPRGPSRNGMKKISLLSIILV